ncbi:uncharacterized protein LOC142495811 [Ascaphus truei]|uniref:uncharacterized protein LOC142495811 n=1 Tax=Ascaphus truei TaxID=8439 RepID=UPI003F59AA37
MDNILLNSNNVSPSFGFAPVDITYPTPPYMSLRELVERNETLPVKERKFMDMMERYDSNDIYYTSMKYEPGVYKKTGFALNSTIRDTLHRWFVLTNGNLFAKALLIPNERNKAKLIIYSYIPPENGRKPVTLRIEGTNLYFSYQSGTLQLQPMTEEDLERINSNTKKFLFLLTKMSTTTRSFESATSPGSFISASTENNGAITVQLGSSNSHTFEFVLAVDLYGSFLKVGRQRISLQKWEERFGNSCNLYSDYNSACTVGRLETE